MLKTETVVKLFTDFTENIIRLLIASSHCDKFTNNCDK